MIAARKAARMARIDYEDLPAILTIDEALAAESLFEAPLEFLKGDPDKALAEAPRKGSGRSESGG